MPVVTTAFNCLKQFVGKQKLQIKNSIYDFQFYFLSISALVCCVYVTAVLWRFSLKLSTGT